MSFARSITRILFATLIPLALAGASPAPGPQRAASSPSSGMPNPAATSTKSAKAAASDSSATAPVYLRGNLARMRKAEPLKAQPTTIEIDLDRAVAVRMPGIERDLIATAFRTPDGREGWAIRIPGSRPIATPAFWQGKLFVGGGYGSTEFYAFDAATGALAWKISTTDDGPTAAVVEDGCVAFNTESCTVMVVDAETGRTLWQEWLGDPLMSQPAISQGRLYMAFPANARGPAVSQTQITHPGGNGAPHPEDDSHRLLCADLRTGRHLWVSAIPAEVITAPVIEGDKVFLACFDGSSLCLDAASGRRLWLKHNGATSAPVIANGQLVMTEKQTRGGEVREGIRRTDAAAGTDRDAQLLADDKADYLKSGSGKSVNIGAKEQSELDGSVGFSSAPSSAGLEKASDHLGVSTVVGGWAYQGSKAAYRGGQYLNAQGQFLNCLSAKDGKLAWRARARGKEVDAGGQVFAPPALGAKNLYACTARGHLISVRQKDGAVQFAYAIGQPMAFQPALAGGSLFAGTNNGMLVCLKTGDPDADGWSAWGGNAQHNRGD